MDLTCKDVEGPDLTDPPTSSKRLKYTVQKARSASDGSDGNSDLAGRASGVPTVRKDYAALDEKVQRRLAQNREAARKSRQRKKDYMKQLELELSEKLRRGEVDEATAATAAALVRAPPARSGATSSHPRPTMSALQQSLRELSSVQSSSPHSSTLTPSQWPQRLSPRSTASLQCECSMPLHAAAELLTSVSAAEDRPWSAAIKQEEAPSHDDTTAGHPDDKPGTTPREERTSDVEMTAGVTANSNPLQGQLGGGMQSPPPKLLSLAGNPSFQHAGRSAIRNDAAAGALDKAAFVSTTSIQGESSIPHSSAMGLHAEQAGHFVSRANLAVLPPAQPQRLPSPTQSPLHSDMLSALSRWRQQHMQTAVSIRRELDHPITSRNDVVLRHLVSDAQSELWSLFQLKQVILSGEGASVILNNQHLLPAELPHAWLGSLRPSEAVAGLLLKLGPSVVQPALGRLRTLQASLGEQEKVAGAGFADLLATLRLHASSLSATAAGLASGQPATSLAGHSGPGSSNAAFQEAWGSNEVLGRLDAVRSLLSQPDRLWEQFLTEAGQVLPLRQYAVAVICWAETSLQLQNMQLPWLQSLQHQRDNNSSQTSTRQTVPVAQSVDSAPAFAASTMPSGFAARQTAPGYGNPPFRSISTAAGFEARHTAPGYTLPPLRNVSAASKFDARQAMPGFGSPSFANTNPYPDRRTLSLSDIGEGVANASIRHSSLPPSLLRSVLNPTGLIGGLHLHTAGSSPRAPQPSPISMLHSAAAQVASFPSLTVLSTPGQIKPEGPPSSPLLSRPAPSRGGALIDATGEVRWVPVTTALQASLPATVSMAVPALSAMQPARLVTTGGGTAAATVDKASQGAVPRETSQSSVPRETSQGLVPRKTSQGLVPRETSQGLMPRESSQDLLSRETSQAHVAAGAALAEPPRVLSLPRHSPRARPELSCSPTRPESRSSSPPPAAKNVVCKAQSSGPTISD